MLMHEARRGELSTKTCRNISGLRSARMHFISTHRMERAPAAKSLLSRGLVRRGAEDRQDSGSKQFALTLFVLSRSVYLQTLYSFTASVRPACTVCHSLSTTKTLWRTWPRWLALFVTSPSLCSHPPPLFLRPCLFLPSRCEMNTNLLHMPAGCLSFFLPPPPHKSFAIISMLSVPARAKAKAVPSAPRRLQSQ